MGRTGGPLPESSLSPRQAQRREQMTDAAFELLLQMPYSKILMRDVAIEAGAALGTLYRYVGSKEYLFSLAAVKWVGRFVEWSDRRLPSLDDNADRIKALLERSMLSFERAPQFYETFMILSSSTDVNVRDNLERMNSTIGGVYRAALTDVDDDRADVIVMCCQAMLDWVLRRCHQGAMSARTGLKLMDEGVEMLLVPMPTTSTRGRDRGRQGSDGGRGRRL